MHSFGLQKATGWAIWLATIPARPQLEVLPMKKLCNLRTGTFVLVALFITMNECCFAQAPTDAAQLMRDVVRNELQSQSGEQSHWRFREIREVDGKKELREVYQTECGDIYRLLSINDVLLNSKETAAERRRLRRVVSDPDRMREKQEEQLADSEKARKILNVLPEAFLYRYQGTEGQLIKLEFTPNQRFHPTERAGEVFQHTTGNILIDRQSKHLAAINGRLTDDVKFGGGLLGHLEKGGTFLVVWKDVGVGHWQLAVIDIEMNGRAMLFKTINIQQKKSYSNYTRLPDDMTPEEAANVLMEQPREANETCPSPQPHPCQK